MEAKRQLTAEEEATRRNTDCIYFLASPLTCKKGSECEFRHSEVARVNPRECWYWMNSNCLNPKCGFRHPPLDGLFESPRLPAGQAGLYSNPNKQNTPCFYFQKGQCVKGDKCPFMHGSNPTTDNASQVATDNDIQDATKISSALPSNTHITNSRALKECTTQSTMSKLTVNRSISNNKYENIAKKPSSSLDYELSRSQPFSGDSTSSKPSHQLSPPAEEEHYINGRENEDYLRESSPGFDVLVDVDGEEYVPREPEFYNNEDDYGGHSKLNTNPDQFVDEFDYINPDYGYQAVPSFEKDEYNRRMHHEWGRDNNRSVQNTHKRRSVQRDLSPVGDVTGLDLRHSLLKKRRVNGHHSDPREVRHADYNRYKDRPFRRNAPPHLSQEMVSISPRLQGRIKLPPNRGISPSTRTSEGRSRFRDRMNHARNFDDRRHRRDDGDSSSFPGPKSLAELKGAKASGSSHQIKSVIEQESNGTYADHDAETFIEQKDGVEDEEMENFDTNDGDGDYEYEGNEGEDFKAVDEENEYEDEQNARLDDEDEFEKKVKGFFS